jgi:hypothetical protein
MPSGSKERDVGDAMRAGDGVLNAVVVLLLILFALGSWYFYGSVRPVADNANPSLMVQPAPKPEPHPVNPVPPSTNAAGQGTPQDSLP